MRPISQAMQQITLDPSANPLAIVEARLEQTADLRSRPEQWAACDGGLPANCEILGDGGLRLKPTAGAAVGSTVQNAWFRPNEPGNTGGTYFDPISNAKFSDQFVGVRSQWNGTGAKVAYSQVQAWLNPRFDSAKPKLVQTWQLIIYQIVFHLAAGPGPSLPYYTLAPVVRAQAVATGEAAGWVVFTFKDGAGVVTPWHPDSYGAGVFGIDALGTEYFVTCYGQDAKGQRVTNVAWGYDNTQTSFVTGSLGNEVKLLAQGFGHLFAGKPSVGAFTTLAGVPAIQLIPVSYASTATVTFKTGSPIDLGFTPTDPTLVEFAFQAEVPIGTSAAPQVALDPAGSFTDFKSGQTATDLSLAAQRKYDMRVTLTANAAGDRTPIVRLLGARLVARSDMGNTVDVIELNEHTDPITHQSEVESCVIRGIHDGERDYRDPISLLLSQNPPGVFSFRIYVGDRRLPRDLWVYHDDFYPQDLDLQEAYTDITCVSCLSQLKQELPVLSSDAVSAPVADSSNVGGWTASSGTSLSTQVADLPEPQWGATTAYLVGQRVLDANSNVQICTVAGTSGGSAPTWTTASGGYTVDATVTWQNLGPATSGLPDDTTYVQSPSNPVNADWVATMGKIGTPQQSVGAMLQVRAATVGAAQSLTLQLFLRQGATPIANKPFTVNVQDTGQGSYLVFQYLLTAAEQASISDWGNLNIVIRANGTGQIRVGWLRLVVLGRRAPYVSSAIGTSPQAIMDDLINNQVALDGRLKGPQYTNPSPALVVAKTIEQDPSGSTDLQRAFDELQRLAWITGGFYMSSQGRLQYRPFYQVATGTDLITGTTTAIFAPLVGPIRAILAPGEVEPISITPGWRQRLPLFRVPWGWNGQNWAGEAQVVNAPALAYYRQDLIEADPRCPAETSKWISGDGLARGLSARHGQSFGLGLPEWRFRCTYAHPEWERGDVITIPTDRFLGYDPIGTRAIAGRQWATGVIVGRHDVLGREWSIWIQSLSAIRPVAMALAIPPFSSQDPNTLGVSGYVGEAAGDATGDALNVFWAGSPAVQSIRVAASLLVNGPSAPGSGSLFVGNSGVANIAGPYLFGTAYIITITPYATVDGSQAMGRAAYVVKQIDGSSISTGFNNQGSGMPVASNPNMGTVGGNPAAGGPWLAFYHAAPLTLVRADQSSIVIPATPGGGWGQGGNIAAPTLAASGTGGLPAGTYRLQIGFVKNNGVVMVGQIAQITVTAGQNIVVTAPTTPSPNPYDGWIYAISDVGAVPISIRSAVGSDPTLLTAFGTNRTVTFIGGKLGDTLGNITTAVGNNNAFVLLQNLSPASYYLYPFVDLRLPAMLGLLDAVTPPTAPSASAAGVQNGDMRVPLSYGPIGIVTIPASGNPNNTQANQGGKFK